MKVSSAFIVLTLLGLSSLSAEVLVDESSVSRLSVSDLGDLLQGPAVESVYSQYGLEDGQAKIDLILDEISRRNAPELIVQRFKQSVDDVQKRYLVLILIRSENDPAKELFQSITNRGTDEVAYWELNYLAKFGDRPALLELVHNGFSYPISSAQWAETCRYFGQYKVTESLETLYDGLGAASFNVVDACSDSLNIILGLSERTFGSMDEMQRFYRKAINEFKKAGR